MKVKEKKYNLKRLKKKTQFVPTLVKMQNLLPRHDTTANAFERKLIISSSLILKQHNV
jgi:hypothetical protein